MTRTSIPSIRVGGPRRTVTSVVWRSAPTPSKVYDTYWRFAYERQEVYIRRLSGASEPWTADLTLRTHRFTNAYRAADRVSQYLIRKVIYPPSSARLTPDDLLFRVLLFKFFNRIETWELLESTVGDVRWEGFCFDDYDRVLTRAIEAGRRLYSAAYIMPACLAMGDGRKHRGHLRLIERILREAVAEKLTSAKTMADAFAVLRAYPMVGDFLAFQYTIDINYSPLLPFSEADFVVAGPGARDGLRKVFADPGGYSDADLIRWVAGRQEQEFQRLALPFKTLWGRQLQLIDCQNLFCEVDKYARVHHPEVRGLSGRTRIKQRFVANGPSPIPWFPPKWQLNDRVAKPVATQEPNSNDRLFRIPGSGRPGTHYGGCGGV